MSVYRSMVFSYFQQPISGVKIWPQKSKPVSQGVTKDAGVGHLLDVGCLIWYEAG